MLRYDRNVVLAAYRAAHPDNLEVEEKTITDFGESLFVTFEDELRTQAAERGIPFDDFNRSMLVFFAVQSTAKTVRTRVRHACRYFLSVKPRL